jgi:eukaryotic-like serine/threonine-protein kinase
VLKFITGKPLWANMLVGGAIFFILIFLLFQSMTCMTRHDKVLPVPSVTGRSYEEAKKLLEGQGFEVQVQDTAFSDTAPLSAVLNQFPEPESIVKMNRTVFLTINRAVPPDIPMPNLEGSTYKSAEIAIQQLGLKIEDTIYRQDMARDMVLEQQFNGQRIKAGDKIAVGSKILLVLGSGLGTETFDMPDLFGYTLSEAKSMLASGGLTIGNIIPQSAGPNSYVFKQSPDHLSPSGKVIQVRQGQIIDIWVQPDKPVRAAATDTTGAQQNAY